jgi:cytidylate kinase
VRCASTAARCATERAPLNLLGVTLVAISSAYGAGGSRIAPALAARLGLPFVDRAIPAAVAEQLDVPFDEAAARDEQVSARWLERLLRGFLGQDVGVGPTVPESAVTGDDFRRATEAAIRAQADTGAGVILGRGAAIVLRDDPRVLRVRLHGPVERRVRSAIELDGIDEETARRRLQRLDRAHSAYARHFYGVDLDDPSLYHVVLDSTAIGHDECVELLEVAARALERAR